MATRSLNKVMLIGNLTRDPVMRFTPTNTAVCNFSIATNRTWSGADGGEKQEQVEYHNIVVWSKLAEVCGQYLHKGDKLYLEGRLQTREWQNKEGQTQRTTEIVMENMIMLSSRSGAGAGQSFGDSNFSSDDSSQAGPAAPAKSKSKKPKATEEVATDDVSDVQDISEEIDIPF